VGEGRGKTGNFFVSGFFITSVLPFLHSRHVKLTKEQVLKKLGGFPQTEPQVLVEDQDVDDIIRGVVKKHKECAHYYDVIFPMFDQDGSWYDVGDRLWTFCKEQIAYRIESTEWQWVSTPATILKNGYCDCKGYALFCAGVIDAMKRAGEDVEWCYRFASYALLNSTPGHVFVVINPETDNIWLDPVLDGYNGRYPRPMWKQDRYVKTCRAKNLAGIGFIPGAGPLLGTELRVAVGATQEQSLLDSINEYTEGLASGIQYAQANGTLNTICLLVLATASIAFPVIAAALAIIKLASTVVSDEFGPNSEAALLLNDVASNPLTAPVTIVETLIKGKTFESDQYRAAQFHQFYVLGNSSINALNKVADNMIPPALKWFVDRTGVFISGAEHIEGLIISPAEYQSYYGVNSYTTMDSNRVNAASNVAQQYWSFNGVAGSWANTLGVYDALVATIAQEQNTTQEAVAAEQNYQDVYSAAATTGANPVEEITSSPVVPLLILAAVGGGLLYVSLKK
jgi:hypothetical protein